jgi:hypothetical protein
MVTWDTKAISIGAHGARVVALTASTVVALWITHNGAWLLPTLIAFFASVNVAVVATALLTELAEDVLVPHLGRARGVTVFYLLTVVIVPVMWMSLGLAVLLVAAHGQWLGVPIAR